MDVLLLLLLTAGLLILYFLPSLIAARAGAANLALVFFINLFLGWTLAGWLVALFWALAGATAADQDLRASIESQRRLAVEIAAFSAGHKKCPRCAELVKAEAIVCRFCGNEFPVPTPRLVAAGAAGPRPISEWRPPGD